MSSKKVVTLRLIAFFYNVIYVENKNTNIRDSRSIHLRTTSSPMIITRNKIFNLNRHRNQDLLLSSDRIPTRRYKRPTNSKRKKRNTTRILIVKYGGTSQPCHGIPFEWIKFEHEGFINRRKMKPLDRWRNGSG